MRSCLFIPANNPGMLQNANLFSADAVIFDLEDAVNLKEKDSARILLQNFLKTFELDLEVIIRINSLDTIYFQEDIEIISDKIDTIMLPKARIEDLKKLDLLLTNIEKVKNLHKQIKIIPIIELAISVLEVEEIAKYPRVKAILLGAEDLSSDLEIERTKTSEEIMYPRARIAYACRAYKIDAIDTPFTDVLDNDDLRNDAKYARSIGMSAKAAIHPNQIAVINEVFSPSLKQIEQANKILAAAKINKGAFSLDGKMVDKPIIERAEKVIEKAKKYDLI